MISQTSSDLRTKEFVVSKSGSTRPVYVNTKLYSHESCLERVSCERMEGMVLCGRHILLDSWALSGRKWSPQLVITNPSLLMTEVEDVVRPFLPPKIQKRGQLCDSSQMTMQWIVSTRQLPRIDGAP